MVIVASLKSVPWRFRSAKHRLGEWLAIKIAWAMPRYVVMWCAVRLMAHATTGKWGNECPDHVDIMTALGRWDDRP